MNKEQKIFQKVVKARYNRLSRLRRLALGELKGRHVKRSPVMDHIPMKGLNEKKTIWGWCVYYWKKLWQKN